jgi:hypothetical protein
MHRAFTIATDPRSWKAWFSLAALVAVLSAVLSGVAATGGQQLPAFWVLWAVMAAAGVAALTVRAVAIARHVAGEMTFIERALWAAWDVAGVLAVCTLLLSNLL